MSNGSSNNTLGTALEVTTFTFGTSPTEPFSNILANDTGGGVVIDGCNNNYLYGTFIGGTTSSKSRVGGNGVTLLNGSSNNRIGSIRSSDEFIIESCEGTGIVLDGAGTKDNLVKGVTIGTFGNTDETKAGSDIHLRNGTNSNMIGGPGPMNDEGASQFGPRQESISMSNLLGTGIWLENCGGTVGTDGVASMQNRIQNCVVNGCDTGILISDNARVNEIGGFLGNGLKGGGSFPVAEFL